MITFSVGPRTAGCRRRRGCPCPRTAWTDPLCPPAENMAPDDAIDVPACCRKAEELFELYQKCANRKQIETICVNYLRGLEATKLSITGHMYFVPRTHMDKFMPPFESEYSVPSFGAPAPGTSAWKIHRPSHPVPDGVHPHSASFSPPAPGHRAYVLRAPHPHGQGGRV